jgi:hypothetical protein
MVLTFYYAKTFSNYSGQIRGYQPAARKWVLCCPRTSVILCQLYDKKYLPDMRKESFINVVSILQLHSCEQPFSEERQMKN